MSFLCGKNWFANDLITRINSEISNTMSSRCNYTRQMNSILILKTNIIIKEIILMLFC